MKSRYAVLFLSLVLALALAVPALGGPTNPIASISASVKATANKALKLAKKAQTTANTALSNANSASSAANSASSAAKTAQKTAEEGKKAAATAQATADAAQATANAAKTAAATAQSTANSKFGNTTTTFGGFEGPYTTTGAALVNCPTGEQITGGGFESSGGGSDEIVPTFDSSYGDAWAVALKRIPAGTESWSVRAIAVCAGP